MIISDMLRALRVRWKLQFAILLMVLGLTIVWIAMTPRSYVATASLLFDDRAPNPVEAPAATTATAATALGTEADIIRSEALAGEVAAEQKLAQKPGVVANWRSATGGTGTVEGWLGRGLLGNLEVVVDRATNVVQVNYKSQDPEEAARLANSFAANYVNTRLMMSTDPAKAYTKWFEERTREVRNKLEGAQQALADFQRERGIISTGSIDAESTRLGELSSQLSGAEAISAEARARASSSAAQSTDVQSSGVVQGLRSQIAAKSAQLSQMRTEFGPNHPEMQAATAELAELRSKLASEIGTTSNSLHVASTAASSREAQIRSLLNAQRARMLGLAADRSKLEVLERDVTSARAAYDSVTERLSTMRLQSSLPRTNVRQLDKAAIPLMPASPNIPLRLFMAIVFGVMLAISAVILLEWLRPRVRTRSGVEQISGVPVLSRISFSRSGIMPLLEGGTSR
ncbi:exopolysaccharide biosynthesis protein [Sphingomonas oleivorans]|uniref:Exopolysaccharide biosynthesis protein n=1 Tax=Sphingomonas oleivorans TaxID=1735121 RepID=A0A2T5FYW4_9SPHN|nr:GNVR domain-containing protein [Sphingomonas oleivorans]PTQ11792.1 exopolysaccharide biosynthesis protein [Sphingomonas oleivorans]